MVWDPGSPIGDTNMIAIYYLPVCNNALLGHRSTEVTYYPFPLVLLRQNPTPVSIKPSGKHGMEAGHPLR